MLYASNVAALVLTGCGFTNNYVSPGASSEARGSVIYLCGGTTGTFADCAIGNPAVPAAAPEAIRADAPAALALEGVELRNNSQEGILLNGARGTLANCLVAGCSNSGVRAASGACSISNCTIVQNKGWGIAGGAAGIAVKSSIVWANTFGGIDDDAGIAVSYTDAQDAWCAGAGAGNFRDTPLFLDPANGDYHLQSKAGSWRETLGVFVEDACHSPCIDAGDPADAWSREPAPNGKRVNLGAYGNTPQASKTWRRGLLIRGY